MAKKIEQSFGDRFVANSVEDYMRYYSRLKREKGSAEATSELRETVKKLRRSFQSRVRSIEFHDLYSHALEKYRENQPQKYTYISEMKYNRLLHELSLYHTFFSSETSKVSEIQRINKEQDLRIFGEKMTRSGKPTGRPARTMTRDERRKYWEVYDEFIAQHPNRIVLSERVQIMIGQTVEKAMKMDDEDFNLVEYLDSIEKKLKEEKEVEYNPRHFNVYAGSRDDEEENPFR